MITVEYRSGRVTWDTALVKPDKKCNVDSSTRIIGVMCCKCPHYEGMYRDFVLCSFHKEDDADACVARSMLIDKARREAMIALDY